MRMSDGEEVHTHTYYKQTESIYSIVTDIFLQIATYHFEHFSLHVKISAGH